MTIEFTTTITGMEAYPIKDSVPLYVFRVYWNYLGDDSVYSTAMQGSTDVPTSNPQSAIPYADLTEEQVMGWVQQYTPSWQFEEYTYKITEWITAQYTPEVVNPPLPWTEVPVVEPVEMPIYEFEPVIEPIE
jgi:hypothetical protein